MKKNAAIKRWVKSAHRYAYPITLTIFCFFFGAGLLLLQRSWLIVRWVPGYARSNISHSKESKHFVHRKEVTLYYWKDEKIKKEIDTCIWREEGRNSSNIQLIVGNWLSFLYEERMLLKRVGLQSIALCASDHELLLSFDHAPFARGWSIRKKWQIIDGLCRTIGGLGLQIQSVLFLVNHEQMIDDHLDFSQPWPVDGFK